LQGWAQVYGSVSNPVHVGKVDLESNLWARDMAMRSGGVQSTQVNEVKSCQILYFLPILSNVKITFKIFKLKLLLERCFAEEQKMH
jgi:hypothetical protein